MCSIKFYGELFCIFNNFSHIVWLINGFNTRTLHLPFIKIYMVRLSNQQANYIHQKQKCKGVNSFSLSFRYLIYNDFVESIQSFFVTNVKRFLNHNHCWFQQFIINNLKISTNNSTLKLILSSNQNVPYSPTSHSHHILHKFSYKHA